jgi:CRP-like cAMP-binding protein
MSSHIVNAKKTSSKTNADQPSKTMSLPDIRALVCHTELLQGLSSTICKTLLSVGRLQRAPGGARLFRQGSPSDVCYVILSGEIRLVQLTPGGKRIIIDIIGPGKHLGFFVALSDKQYPVTAEVIEDCDLYAWNASVIRHLLLKNQQLTMSVLSALTDRVICLQTKVQQFATERVEQRIANSLLSLAERMGKNQKDGILINMPLTHQDLAEMSGTNIYSVSRVLNKWEAEEIIITSRKRILLRAPERLSSRS